MSLCSICFRGKDFLCRMVPQISRDNLKNSKNGSFEGWKGGVGLKDQETRQIPTFALYTVIPYQKKLYSPA